MPLMLRLVPAVPLGRVRRRPSVPSRPFRYSELYVSLASPFAPATPLSPFVALQIGNIVR
jgi:hypothetical protein